VPELKFILEAALLAADEPLSVERLQAALFEAHQQPSREALQGALAELRRDYAGRGIELVEVASGFRIQVRQELSPWVSRLWEERAARYSRALLETLALIAYRQPITRGEIEEVRGVSVSSSIIKTLVERGWIKVVGHREVPGRPALYGTTRVFLDYFNLRSLADLPPLSEIRDLEAIGQQLDLLRMPIDATSGPPLTSETDI
jgi:segregation and condensation protein B